jgi:hypothetical protein
VKVSHDSQTVGTRQRRKMAGLKIHQRLILAIIEGSSLLYVLFLT